MFLLPNVLGMGASPRYDLLNVFDSGAMSKVRSSSSIDAPVQGTRTEAYAQGIDASLSNPIFGSSKHVQPAAVQFLMIIKA